VGGAHPGGEREERCEECMWAGPTLARFARLELNRGTTSILKIERSTKVNTPLKNRVP